MECQPVSTSTCWSSFPRTVCPPSIIMHAYALMKDWQKRLAASNCRPEHFKPGGPVHLRAFRLPHHKIHRHLSERDQRRPDESLRYILIDPLCHRILRHPLHFGERCGSRLLRLLCQPTPDLNLLENLLLVRVSDAPMHVAIPDVLQSMPHALLSWETGHHRIRQLQLELAIQRVDQLILRLEVGKQRAFRNPGRTCNGCGRSTQSPLRENLGGG